MRILFITFFSIFSVMFLVACGPVDTPPVSTYALTDLHSVPTPLHTKTRSSLLITNPVANPGYETAAMIYMVTPYELRSFADNRWVAPPAQMLLPMLTQAVRKTGYFYAVVSPPFSGLTHYRLDTQILKLQQEFLLPTSVVRLSVQASLLSSRTNLVLASRLFEVSVVAQTNNPYGGVLAANQAAAIIADRIAKFCVQSVR